MPVFDVLLMKQSVSHKSARALILIINAVVLNNNPNKGTCVWSQPLSTLIHCHSFRLNLRSQNLGQQSLTRCSNLHTKKKKMFSHPLFFLWTAFGRVPESQPLLVFVVPHFLIRVHPPASSHHAREGKQSWHVSLMRSRDGSVGKEHCFHTH